MEIEKELDTLYPKLRIGKKCAICGKRQADHVHHIVGRSNRLLRWDVKNLLPVCASCHSDIHDKGLYNRGLDFVPEEIKTYLGKRKNENAKEFFLFTDEEAFFQKQKKEILENIGKTSYLQNTDEWLAEKSRKIGASEIAAIIKSFVAKERLMEIMGEKAAGSFINEPLYTTGYCVYHKVKNGYKGKDIDPSLADYGHAMEKYAEHHLLNDENFSFSRTQDYIEREDISLFAACSPDGYARSLKQKYADINGRVLTYLNPVWEIKTINPFKAEKENALLRGLQWQYLFQLQYQMLLCERQAGVISSIVLSAENDNLFNRGKAVVYAENNLFEKIDEELNPSVFSSVYGRIEEMQNAIQEALHNFEKAFSENKEPEMEKENLPLAKKDWDCYQAVHNSNLSGILLITTNDKDEEGNSFYDFFNEALFFSESIRMDSQKDDLNKLKIKRFMEKNKVSEIYTIDGGTAKITKTGRLYLKPLKGI